MDRPRRRTAPEGEASPLLAGRMIHPQPRDRAAVLGERRDEGAVRTGRQRRSRPVARPEVLLLSQKPA